MDRDPERALDDEVRELRSLLIQITREWDSQPGPEPGPLQQALDSGAVGRRHLPVLFSLALDGPGGVGEIADRLGLAAATTSQLVNELSRAGFVERREDQRDRRRTLVRLDVRYRRTIEARAVERARPLRQALERLGGAGRDRFLDDLRLLADETATASAETDSRHTG